MDMKICDQSSYLIQPFLVWHHLTYLLVEQGNNFSSSQSSNFSNTVQGTGTYLVSYCLRLCHGKFEGAFDDFLQHFSKLLDVYHFFVSAFISCIPICICQGWWYRICILTRLSGWSLSDIPSNLSGTFCLYQFLPCTYLSLDHCFGSSGSRQ